MERARAWKSQEGGCQRGKDRQTDRQARRETGKKGHRKETGKLSPVIASRTWTLSGTSSGVEVAGRRTSERKGTKVEGKKNKRVWRLQGQKEFENQLEQQERERERNRREREEHEEQISRLRDGRVSGARGKKASAREKKEMRRSEHSPKKDKNQT